ncbi:baseplate J/gp47 family protein [Comamonas aquatica]|uniref:Baseplate J/gp47 family protein n=1 Tax=Comamonas aquatica TaxID=225991 RepID=A0AA42HQI8_9BURK|nr:baseplate J/gp47 family protein [Comamonas aquatica]MDH0362784.1 baseplate J/gp47 family protein [Comamonas aquatica]
MSFHTPSLPELITRTGADIEGADGLRRSDAAVLARVHAAGLYGLYQYLDWLSRQIFPDTAEEEHLLRRGNERGVLRKEAQPAMGMLLLGGTDGAPVNAGTRWVKDGVLYEATEGVNISGTTPVPVQAVDAGAAGNLQGGEQVTAVQPILGVNSVATVAPAGITGGTDLEDIEDYRERVLDRYRQLPHGGNADDYVTWAKEQPGVTRAWCKRSWVGPGTVGVFVVNDAADPITPAAPALAAVKAGIEAQRPVTAELYVLAPALKPVDYVIGLTPDTPRVRAAVESSLRALHARNAELGGTVLRTHMAEAISSAAGEMDHELAQPAANVVPQPHELPVFGSITWL